MYSTLTPDGLRLPQGLSCEPSLPLRAAGASETIEDVILASRPTASEETPWYRPQPSGCSGCAADGRAYPVCVFFSGGVRVFKCSDDGFGRLYRLTLFSLCLRRMSGSVEALQKVAAHQGSAIRILDPCDELGEGSTETREFERGLPGERYAAAQLSQAGEDRTDPSVGKAACMASMRQFGSMADLTNDEAYHEEMVACAQES